MLSVSLKAQLTQIATNTSQKLTYLSAINKSVIVGGLFDYAGKCNDNCSDLTALSVPGISGSALNFFRPNTNDLYCVSYTPNQTLLFFSADNGTNWVQKLDTIGDLTRYLAFYNSSSGFMSWENSLIETSNGADTWNLINTPLIWPTAVSAIGVYGDSLLCIGGDDGSIYLSRDRGQNWPSAWGLGTQVIKDFSFLNKDTIFALSVYGGLAKTTNGGSSWSNSTIPIYSTYGIAFKDKFEGYIVGATANGYGVIAQTKDMGLTWTIFPTQIYSTFFNVELVNDSLALISGSNGILLSWNYKTTLITGDLELDGNQLTKFYPNPTEGDIIVESAQRGTIHFFDLMGEERGVYTLEQKKNEFNLSSLPKGSYLCRIEYPEKMMFYKLILK